MQNNNSGATPKLLTASPEEVQKELVTVLKQYIAKYKEKRGEDHSSLLASYFLIFFDFNIDDNISEYPQSIARFFRILINNPETRDVLVKEMGENAFKKITMMLERIVELTTFFYEQESNFAAVKLSYHESYGISETEVPLMKNDIAKFTALLKSEAK